MIIIHLMGGLGNQLYQYAFYEKLKKMGKEVKLDTYAFDGASGDEKEWRKLELDRFPFIQYEKATETDREKLLDNSSSLFAKVRRKLFGRRDKTVKETKEYMPELFDMDDIYLYGFWNCEKYYEEDAKLLQEKLQFPVSLNPKNQACMQQMKKENAISLHIRRTDYLTVADGKRYTGICTEAYYEAAINYIKDKVENPVFYIFSDDISYCKAHYRDENMHIVDWNTGEDSLFDMQLMSCCRHNICANSTFSIWGARLNPNEEKIMIRPLHHDNYEQTTPDEVKNYWKHWCLIDSQGNIYE